jgi:bacterial/archaeal transporter family protein
VDRWVWYALASMAFAGATAVIAKYGLESVSADLASAVRTSFVFLFTIAFAAAVVPRDEYSKLTGRAVVFLALSAAATAASWVCYYRAIKDGPVASVNLIDKGSLLVTVLLAWVLLGEKLTPRLVAGCVLMAAGLVVASRK